MSYHARSMPEAVRLYRQDALPHIALLAVVLGIPFDRHDPKVGWYEHAKRIGDFNRSRSRDRIYFRDPNVPDRIGRTIGDVRPVGDPELKQVLTNRYGPNDYETTVTPSWRRGTRTDIQDTSSSTHGWSVTVTQGLEVGGEAAGAKYIAGLELGTHGEYSKGKVEGSGEDLDAASGESFVLPAGEIAQVVQAVRTGPVEIDVVDDVLLGLAFRVGDWKHRKNGRLDGHAGHAIMRNPDGSGTRSRWHWDCLDADDFRTAFEGTNPRYPGMKVREGAPLSEWQSVKRHFDWLLADRHRTVRVQSKAHGEQGVWGESRIQRIDANGRLAGESGLS